MEQGEENERKGVHKWTQVALQPQKRPLQKPHQPAQLCVRSDWNVEYASICLTLFYSSNLPSTLRFYLQTAVYGRSKKRLLGQFVSFVTWKSSFSSTNPILVLTRKASSTVHFQISTVGEPRQRVEPEPKGALSKHLRHASRIPFPNRCEQLSKPHQHAPLAWLRTASLFGFCFNR